MNVNVEQIIDLVVVAIDLVMFAYLFRAWIRVRKERDS